MVHAGLMEKIMIKTNAINTAATSERELTEAELEHVSGGKLLEAAVKGKVFKTVEIHGTASYDPPPY
jgi:bacteriocin-like protein